MPAARLPGFSDGRVAGWLLGVDPAAWGPNAISLASARIDSAIPDFLKSNLPPASGLSALGAGASGRVCDAKSTELSDFLSDLFAGLSSGVASDFRPVDFCASFCAVFAIVWAMAIFASADSFSRAKRSSARASG